jgi:hypothetical protein
MQSREFDLDPPQIGGLIMNNWVKENKSVLIGGLVPGAIVSLSSLAIIYSIWVSLAVCVGSFVVINFIILVIESRNNWDKENKKRCNL